MIKWLVILGTIYILILIFLAYLSRRRIRNANDFMMGGFNIGVVLGFMTFAATLFSTFTLMGMPDFFRIHGVGAWIFLAVSDGGMVYFILWFGYKLRKSINQKEYKGMSGFLNKKYGTKSVGILYFIGIFIFLIPYVAIQIRGISIFLDAAFDNLLPVWAWALIIIGIMVIYSETGGLKAIIYSDVLQGVLLLIVVWIIAGRFIDQAGGLTALFNEVEKVDVRLLSVPGPKGLFNYQFLIASFIAIVMIPVTQPQISTRLVVMKNLTAMKKMSVGVGLFAIAVIFPTVILGMKGATDYASLSTADFLAKVLIQEHSEIIATLIMIGLIAAAISTSDSQIFALGSEIRSLLRGTEKKVLIKTKSAMLTFAIFAFVFSLISSDQLVLLARVSFAGTAMMGPMILAAVFIDRIIPKMIIWVTGIGEILFICSLIGIIPSSILGVQMDLLLLTSLFSSTGIILLIDKMRGQY